MVAVSDQELNETRRVWYGVACKFGGVLSMIGSALIVRHILTTKKMKWREISLPNAILLRISIVDIIASFFVYFLSFWMVPRGTPHVRFASGTDGTCALQGWSDTFSMTYFATAYTQVSRSKCSSIESSLIIIGRFVPIMFGSINFLFIASLKTHNTFRSSLPSCTG